MKAFVICPVRGGTPDWVYELVASLEAEGWAVHLPPRDTDQDDPTGYRICRDNMAAIASSDRIYVAWDGQSQGGLFDAGMLFAIHHLIGPKEVIPVRLPEPTEGKSFQNMITEWAGEADDRPTDPD